MVLHVRRFALFTRCWEADKFEPFAYSAPNAIDLFNDSLILIKQQVGLTARLGKNVNMFPLTLEQHKQFDEAKICVNYSNEEFTTKTSKVRHHNHEDDHCIASACNVQLEMPYRRSLGTSYRPLQVGYNVDPMDITNQNKHVKVDDR